MANCVLCGKKIGWIDQVKVDFHGTRQIFCCSCAGRYSQADSGEREELRQRILQSPYLADGETLRANLDTGKLCPACGAVLERKLTNFSIGADGNGGLTALYMPQYDVDLYACPKCGKVELYTAAASLSQTPGQPLSQRVRDGEQAAPERPGQGLSGRGGGKPPWEN